MGMVKGKIPIREVCEYDPNINPAKDGLPREKHQKTTSSSLVKGKRKPHVVS